MVVSLGAINLADSRSLEQVSPNGSTRYLSAFVKLDFNKFTKSTSPHGQKRLTSELVP